MWLRARGGSWLEVRLDAKVPGTVLLRDEGSGGVFYITYNNIQQVGWGEFHAARTPKRAAGARGRAPRPTRMASPLFPKQAPQTPRPPLIGPSLPQIDLTDDYVVMALFGDGAWEDQLQRLQARENEDGSGALVDVAMDQEAFRDLISAMADG